MAKKAFEIQGSDLSLGGVNLQAGTNGVVIPGITQATNYFVEEVDDTSVDQTTTIENTPLVIDAVSYNALLSNQSIATYSTYTVELEDNFYIDEITVASRGTYTEQEKTMNETTDMWAYGGVVGGYANTITFTGYDQTYYTGDTVLLGTNYFQFAPLPTEQADLIRSIQPGDTVRFTGNVTPTATYERVVVSVEEFQSGNKQFLITFTGGVLQNVSAGSAEGCILAIEFGVSNPTANFVSTDWFQIPFRPKMRADEVTTIGGGGSGSRVKLESPGDRRIEEVYGYKEVSVTGETVGSEVTATVYDSNAGSEWQLWVPTTAELTATATATNNSGLLHNIRISGDQINYYNASIGTNNLDYTQLLLKNDILLAFDQGQTVYYQIVTGGDPVVWWDASELPGGSTDFRGAVIDYHAYTGESTIIGTIHIVRDSGEEHISHTEVQSGTTDGENDDLWLVTQEGQIKYRRIDRESKTLKVQWSAKVFYGSEYYD
jgi:hypothetical protein